MGILEEIARLGGAAKTVELRQHGLSKKELARSVRSGTVLRARKGWYVLPSTPAPLVAAVRVGGRATCVTALAHYDVWLTDHIPLVHVAVHREASRLRSVARAWERQSVVGDAVVHWADTPRPRRVVGSRLVETPIRALRDVVDCLQGEELLATVESALHHRLVDPDEWALLLQGMTRAQRRLLEAASGLSGSGIETLFVHRIRSWNVRVRQQVHIGMDRVDVVIGDRLVVELDGAAFHDPHADKVRDARLILERFHVVHFDYWQILYAWPTVERVILALLIRGDHLR